MDQSFTDQEQSDLAKPKNRPEDQPAPHAGYGQSMHDVACADIRARFMVDRVLEGVIEDFQRRKKFGLERYGTVLQAGNGRDPYQDAYDEGLDMAVYILQAKHESGPAERETLARLDTVYNLTLHSLTVLKALMLERSGE